MFPLAVAAIGGAAVAAGLYKKRKNQPARGERRLQGAAFAVYAEVQTTLQDLETEVQPLRQAIEVQRRKLTVVMARSATTMKSQFEAIREEVQIVAISVYEEAQTTLQQVADKEIKPLQEAFSHQGPVIDVKPTPAWEFRDAIKNPANGKRPRLTLKTVRQAIKQAKDLVLSDDTRSRQFDQMNGPADGSARWQISQAETVVNRYLKVAASSVGVATLGVLLIPPLKLVSGVMILYAALPVFKGAIHDVAVERRISIKILDSVSFIGLLAGGYFLICSLTSTIFHASTKMMLKTEDRSRQMLANMFGEQPRTVWVKVDGKEVEIPFEELSVGNTLIVHAGQMIPVDGVIADGTASVDQHVLTGEAQPAEKGVGDPVFAATMLLAGRIEVRVEKAGSETAAAQIREILANTTDFRTAIQARWRNVADHTVLPTLGMSAVALAVLNPASALAVVNSNYVAVMKVASPLGMLNFLQRASQAGILIKDGRALEVACTVDTVVFDKTGTLTETQPHVGEIITFDGLEENEVLQLAAAVEAKQSHPIAQAILEAAQARKLELPELEEARFEVGYGIQARVGDRLVRVGSGRYMKMERISLPQGIGERQAEMQEKGASVVFVAFDDKLAGAIELRPTLRPEAKDIVSQLKQRGLTVYIISGDHRAPTRALASELGIDHFFAEVLPQDKSRHVEELQQQGRRVCFVGDGINDAIALKKANVSVSLLGASSLATNTAQIILMDESLRQLDKLFEVARDYDSNLKTLMGTTFGPGFVSLASVFLLGTGNGTALALFNLSMLAGLVNGIWPALQQQVQEDPKLPAASDINQAPAAAGTV